MKLLNFYKKNETLTGEQKHILYKTFYKEVFRTIYYFIKNKEVAKELTNEAFITSFEKYHTLKDKDKFKAWTCSIGLNIAKNYMKKYSREIPVENESDFDEEYESAESEVMEKLHKEESRDKVKDCISKLDNIYKEVICLRYYNEMTYEEISKELNVNKGTIRSRINRAKQKIEKLLKEDENSNE